MRIRLALAVLVTALGTASTAYAEACRPTLAASIDLTIAPNAYSLMAPVSLNGRRTYFAVDTGGIISTLRYDVADQLSLPMGDAQFQMINVAGQRLDRVATVQHFELGEFDYPNAQLMLEPEHDMASGLHGPISGTLSPDVLRNFDVEFDLAAAKLNLFRPTTCENPAYWNPSGASAVKMEVAENGHVTFPMALDGRRIQTLLDTGMSITAIDLATARDKFGVDLASGKVERIGRLTHTDEGTLYLYQFKSLAIEHTSISLERPSITLMPDLSPSATDNGPNDAKLILGLSSLQHMHLYIAYKRQMLYVTPASGPPAAYNGPPELGSEPNSLRRPPQ